MYVVFAEELEDVADIRSHTVESLEQAFAQIVCRCGYAYHFEQTVEGWKLIIVDVERPGCSPDPIVSSYKKPKDAKQDLIAQAIDGRLKGHVAVNLREFDVRHSETSRQGRNIVSAYEQ